MYKKLTRFVIRCDFCGKKTDCLAENLEESIKKFQERKWSVQILKSKNNGEELKKVACRYCSYNLSIIDKETEVLRNHE